MFYRFNQLIGHVLPATQKAAYIPQGFKLKVLESPPFRFGSAQIKPAVVPDVMTGKTKPPTGGAKQGSKS